MYFIALLIHSLINYLLIINYLQCRKQHSMWVGYSAIVYSTDRGVCVLYHCVSWNNNNYACTLHNNFRMSPHIQPVHAENFARPLSLLSLFSFLTQPLVCFFSPLILSSLSLPSLPIFFLLHTPQSVFPFSPLKWSPTLQFVFVFLLLFYFLTLISPS